MMPERHRLTAEVIRAELAKVTRMADLATRLISRGQELPDDIDAFSAAAALAMHNAYTGVEEVFREIARAIDGDEPQGPEWHRRLLRQMATALPGVRPAVISAELRRELRGMLGFRHVVRSSYSDELDPARVEEVAGEVAVLVISIERELNAFAEWLDASAEG